MTDRTPRPSSPDTAVDRELDGKPVFAPYDPPAGGWGALRGRTQRLQSALVDELARTLPRFKHKPLILFATGGAGLSTWWR